MIRLSLPPTRDCDIAEQAIRFLRADYKNEVTGVAETIWAKVDCLVSISGHRYLRYMYQIFGHKTAPSIPSAPFFFLSFCLYSFPLFNFVIPPLSNILQHVSSLRTKTYHYSYSLDMLL
jgi:hypothetical protein